MQNLAKALQRRRGKGINLQILIDPIDGTPDVQMGGMDGLQEEQGDPEMTSPHAVSEVETDMSQAPDDEEKENELGLAPEVNDTPDEPVENKMKGLSAKMGRGNLLDRFMKRK